MAISLNKTIEKASAVGGLWSLTLADVEGILIGEKIDVEGFMTASYNKQGMTVTNVDTTTKVVQYQTGNTTVAEFTANANLHLVVSWIDTAYVEDMLGFIPTDGDLTFLQRDVDAANDWAYTKRAEAGYNPHPAYAGGENIRLGTGLYAMLLYRERGTSGDTYAAFNAMGQFERPVSIGRIMQLLGCGRAQVA